MKNNNDYQDTVTNHLAEAQLGRFDSHRSYSIAIYALEEGIELEIDNNNADKANKLLKFYANLVPSLPQDLANQAREFLADYNMAENIAEEVENGANKSFAEKEKNRTNATNHQEVDTNHKAPKKKGLFSFLSGERDTSPKNLAK